MNIKKHLPLIVALSIPVAMVIAVALSIYIPKWNAVSPSQDFLYTTGYDYEGESLYYIKDGVLQKKEIQKSPNSPELIPYPKTNEQIRIFRYDIKANSAEELSFEVAQKLMLDSSAKSSDGFEVSYGYSGGGDMFPFGGGGSSGVYIKSNKLSQKLNIGGGATYYDPYSFNFLGWVK